MTPRILVIEDEEALGLILQEYLEYLGYEVVVASDGASAVVAAARRTFALALVDINLPDMSGIEVMRRLRARSDVTAFIVVSGNLRETYARDARDLEVAAILEKPVDLDDLQQTVASIVGLPPKAQAS